MRSAAVNLRRGAFSWRFDLRAIAAIAAVSAVAAVAIVLSVVVGEFQVSPAQALSAVLGTSARGTEFIVVELRLPRALTALLAGAALGVAGAIFQEVTRNALVSPDVVGISSGASVGAVAVIVLTPWDGPYAIPGAALAGALLAGALLFGLSARGGTSGYQVVLVGIGLAAFLTAAVSYLLTKGRIFEASEAYIWIVGTVNGRSWEHVVPLAASAAFLIPVALLLARRLDALVLGDDLAAGLGVSVARSRFLLLAVATVLTGVAVSATGPIGFVAFIAPHLARRLLGGGGAQSLIPAAAACGAALVLVSDLGARVVFSPTEMPVGLITSIVAAPYFLLMLRRAGRIGAAG